MGKQTTSVSDRQKRRKIVPDKEVTAVEKGGGFEDAVQSIYEGLGFIVERNVRISGQQVDLVIRKSLAGIGMLKFLVECKFITRGSLPNQEVQDFVSFIRTAVGRDGITGGILVCSRDFSVNAKAVASLEDRVELKRMVDIERELFDVTELLRHAVRDFEQGDIFNHYVPLDGSTTIQGKSGKVLDVLGFLSRWSSTAINGGLITILGDFGSGKTTLLQRLYYIAAKAAISSARQDRIPIFFALRDRQRYRSIEDYIEGVALKQFERKIPAGLFWQQLGAGRFVVTLDGFDEISTKVTVERRAQLFYDLSPLLTTRSPAIMSCRPSYFVSKSEFRSLMEKFENNSKRLLGAQISSVRISDRLMQKYTEKPEYLKLARVNTSHIELQTFDEMQIDTYLKRREGEFSVPWQKVKKFLLSIYDLSDLMSRPILLSMIADTVIDGNVDVSQETTVNGPAGLYEMYTDIQFHRDTYKGEERRLLSSDQRRYFAHATALAMLENQSLVVSYKQIMEIIRVGIKQARGIALPTDASDEEIGTDVLTCAFLTVTTDEKFRFTHKSFMEFFLAQYFRLGLIAAFSQSNISSAIRLLNKVLPNEVLAFLSHYSKVGPEGSNILPSHRK